LSLYATPKQEHPSPSLRYMEPLEPNPAGETIDLPKIVRAIRFAFVCGVLGLSYLNVRCALSIYNFEQIFHDMLGNKPLPFITTFVIYHSQYFRLLSFALPVIAIATLFSRGLVRPFYILGFVIGGIIAELIVLYIALMSPLTQIISAMGTAPQ